MKGEILMERKTGKEREEGGNEKERRVVDGKSRRKRESRQENLEAKETERTQGNTRAVNSDSRIPEQGLPPTNSVTLNGSVLTPRLTHDLLGKMGPRCLPYWLGANLKRM